eukprot:TRINITY_DN2224_c0_g1_i2.p1 TRINITY_DN2224_c0_g1~~TRINITY_DN2224_c0_g1_i2.p1  ORF type:complete len:435 (+),score=61.63 TRINITY_DN2224_c0_g1_i2:606-1910(+)
MRPTNLRALMRSIALPGNDSSLVLTRGIGTCVTHGVEASQSELVEFALLCQQRNEYCHYSMRYFESSLRTHGLKADPYEALQLVSMAHVARPAAIDILLSAISSKTLGASYSEHSMKGLIDCVAHKSNLSKEYHERVCAIIADSLLQLLKSKQHEHHLVLQLLAAHAAVMLKHGHTYVKCLLQHFPNSAVDVRMWLDLLQPALRLSVASDFVQNIDKFMKNNVWRLPVDSCVTVFQQMQKEQLPRDSMRMFELHLLKSRRNITPVQAAEVATLFIKDLCVSNKLLGVLSQAMLAGEVAIRSLAKALNAFAGVLYKDRNTGSLFIKADEHIAIGHRDFIRVVWSAATLYCPMPNAEKRFHSLAPLLTCAQIITSSWALQRLSHSVAWAEDKLKQFPLRSWQDRDLTMVVKTLPVSKPFGAALDAEIRKRGIKVPH